ncbi:MAG: hypothetical protein U1F57_02480 [bacterium]
MDLGYEGEELGYEAGYETGHKREIPRTLSCLSPETPSVFYHCQQAPGAATTKPLPVFVIPPAGSPTPLAYNKDGWKINDKGEMVPDSVYKGKDGAVYSVWKNYKDPKQSKIVKNGNNSDFQTVDLSATSPSAVNTEWSGVASPAPLAPGAPDPKKPVFMADAAPKTVSIHEIALRDKLSKKGLSKDEVDAYMQRFDDAPPAYSTKDKEMKKNLDVVETKDADELRKMIATRARDKAVAHYKASGVSPREAYDNLKARGVVDDPTGNMRPSATAQWKDVDVKEWKPAVVKGESAKKISEDPLVSKSDFKTNPVEVRKDTERRLYLKSAEEKYVAWATSPKATPPTKTSGLGLTEAEARKRFNERAIQLKMIDAEGNPTAFDPEATGENDPAQAFFPVEAGKSRFNDDGSVNEDAKGKFRHEDLTVNYADPKLDASKLDPVSRAAYENSKSEGARNLLYYTLTGEQFDAAHPVEIPKDTKVLNPPLSRTQALAYMQSKNLTDAEGKPLPGVSADSIMADANGIQSGDLGSEKVKYTLAAWERNQIAKTLAGPPYNMNPQEITRFMHSHGWLGDHPNLENMESFRKKAASAKPGSDEAKAIIAEVKAADVKGNDPIDLTERDRAADIKDALNTASANGKHNDAKDGREASALAQDKAADTQLKVVKIQTESQEKIARDNREAKRLDDAVQRDWQAKENEKQRNHDTEERAKDRQNQLMMALLQFVGQMISTAVQAMSQVTAASIQSSNQLSGQIIGGMKPR